MNRHRDLGQVLIAAGVVAAGLVMLAQIPLIPAHAGYAGIGPRFFPSLIALGLCGLGILLLVEALTRGFPHLEPGPHETEPADWGAFAWVGAGLVAQMALIGWIGFTLAGTLLGACVGKALGGGDRMPRVAVASFLVSLAIYQGFGKLGVNLPALWTGWL
ncbi:MAG TPA: tripartite tricarboxylate transporter TctB family protein [Candidatus Competibacteraceae bacterium]|nr:tripartite tricarboxylate transporter TctB family protein [Candidatus Competibacteraceae bacterium]